MRASTHELVLCLTGNNHLPIISAFHPITQGLKRYFNTYFMTSREMAGGTKYVGSRSILSVFCPVIGIRVISHE